MLERKKELMSYYDARRIVEQCAKDTRNDTPTAKQVVQYMIGNSDNWHGGDFVVYRYENKSKRTLFNRLNILWVWPAVLLFAPFQYLATGEIGFNRNTVAGRAIDWLVKFD